MNTEGTDKFLFSSNNSIENYTDTGKTNIIKESNYNDRI